MALYGSLHSAVVVKMLLCSKFEDYFPAGYSEGVTPSAMGTPSSFSTMFSKGDNFPDFLFVYLEDKIFPKWDLLLKERICSYGSKFFPLKDDPIL